MEVQVPTPSTVDITTTTNHIVVVPYPSRGHINPMLNFCKILVSKNSDILITFVVTEEWLNSIGSEQQPQNLRFCSVPNVVPELGGSADNFLSVVKAVMTKMEAPFEEILDQLKPQPKIIICDAFLFWAIDVGIRKNIPVAPFWTTSTSEFWVQCFHIFPEFQRSPQKMLESGEKLIDYVPGISSVRLSDIHNVEETNPDMVIWAMKSCEMMLKAQYLLFPSVYEIEHHVVEAIKEWLKIPIYTFGPNIPYFSIENHANSLTSANGSDHSFLQWLNNQPNDSVIYISFGSFLSVSSEQMDEIADALRDSGVRFLWMTRSESSKLKEISGEMGQVIPWCNQLKVLLHPAVGGYWTHCGWNSTMEGIYAGVPFLTFPLILDQPLVSKLIVDNWKVGWRVKKEDKLQTLVKRDEISVLLRKFMDLDNDEGREMRKRSKELQHISESAIAIGGSSDTNVKEFLNNIVN
ncbi:hypothetical protein TanjilG_10894 [Lupinus angustifolius]|uniref:Glycosyltransferase n=1 Tax=Lupinus angustifolius TaxID=3871 RepID=A0A1J7H3U8_LUPAN|nr:PREDICTED: UDP-glycosyltransferase 87A1-like [Lupinus angustifolius]OIV95074.1 hypothetical protein TanjilG_10894 [Lupinus angustifolius]